MTDITTMSPTDAEIFALEVAHTKRHETRDCTGYFSEFDIVAFTLSAIAKWGAPAPASHEALTAALAACRDAFPVPASGSAAEFEWQGAMTDPLGVPAYVRACAAPPAQEARVPLSDEGVGKRAKVGPIHTEPGGKVSMFSVQYRQQLEQCYVRGFRDAEKHHGITAAQQKETP